MKNLKILNLPEVGSTNAYLLERLKNENLPEGLVVVTQNQTAGRGMDENKWESEPCKNLTFSLLLRPPIAVDKQFYLNKAIALAIFDCLAALIADHTITIKWPNDIYVGNRKVCGMLIQNSVTGSHLDYTVAGIGLNVNQLDFHSDAPNPVSMKNVTGIDYDLTALLDKVLEAIGRRYGQVCTGSFETIAGEYEKALFRLNEWQDFEIKNARFSACIRGTNEFGQLLLGLQTGETMECDVKEVKFLNLI